MTTETYCDHDDCAASTSPTCLHHPVIEPDDVVELVNGFDRLVDMIDTARHAINRAPNELTREDFSRALGQLQDANETIFDIALKVQWYVR